MERIIRILHTAPGPGQARSLQTLVLAPEAVEYLIERSHKDQNFVCWQLRGAEGLEPLHPELGQSLKLVCLSKDVT